MDDGMSLMRKGNTPDSAKLRAQTAQSQAGEDPGHMLGCLQLQTSPAISFLLCSAIFSLFTLCNISPHLILGMKVE